MNGLVWWGRPRLWLAVVSTVGSSACATTGATLGSGVGDAFVQHPPYYAGRQVSAEGTIAHLPIGYQRGATQPTTFDPAAGPETPVGRLLAEMNAYLESLGVTVRVAAQATGTAPDVMFGCERQPGDECEGVEEPMRHRLAVGRPSASWVEWAGAAAGSAGADRVLVLTLETGNYWPRQRNLLGQKEIELGTGYTADVPWLTALDRPASVLQLTGALVDRDGRAIRIGAEGLLARRTNVLLGGFGVQALISDEDVERVRTERRTDLPGRPLVWQAAVRNMVAQLTGRADLALR